MVKAYKFPNITTRLFLCHNHCSLYIKLRINWHQQFDRSFMHRDMCQRRVKNVPLFYTTVSSLDLPHQLYKKRKKCNRPNKIYLFSNLALNSLTIYSEDRYLLHCLKEMLLQCIGGILNIYRGICLILISMSLPMYEHTLSKQYNVLFPERRLF